MYKHIFGPVPSRRLGMSLGVDLVPHKVCSFDCIYCECGPTTNRTLERKEFVSAKEVISELQDYLSTHPCPDYITFSGAGEPTLNSKIGEVIHFIKKINANIPVAVLTNGSLLNQKQVRNELLNSDIILPSLDAATYSALKKINRPHPHIQLETYIKGLIDLRKEYNGAIWLEIMIIPGINDGTENLQLLKKAIEKIKPDKIQLNTLDRPGCAQNIRAANKHELNRIIRFWQLDNVEVIGPVTKRTKLKSYHRDIEKAILNSISRRPSTIEDLEIILGMKRNEINKYLGILEANNKIKPVQQLRGTFYEVTKKYNNKASE